MGGPWDLPHHGDTADEVIKAQDRHLKEMGAGGDEKHERALKDMKGRWKRPISGMSVSLGAAKHTRSDSGVVEP
jgi:hypothetical protein